MNFCFKILTKNEVKRKMKTKLLLLFTLLSVSVLPVFAINWISCADKIYVDSDNIAPYYDILGNQVKGEYTYWLKVLNNQSDSFKSLEKDFNKKIWYNLSYNKISCKTRTTTPINVYFYDLKNNPIETFNLSYEQPSAIVPGSVSDFIYQSVCLAK